VKDNRLLYAFIGLTLTGTIFIFLQALILTVAGVKQGNNVHRNIIKGLLYADIIQFFNRVPLGRILGRLSKDLKELDEVITAIFCSSITSLFKILSCIIITIYTSTPYAIVPIIIVAILFIKVRSVYINSQN
jgi:ABC-type multidrug transport system fused ATPase/permease subunit